MSAPRRPVAPSGSSDPHDRTLILVPAFNEAGRVGAVVQELRTRFPHVLVVDDGSSDATANEALRCGAIVLRHPLNRGQGAALETGLAFARERSFDFVVTFDADGQHRTADVERLLRPLVDGRASIALGSRFLGATRNMPPGRRMLLKTALLFTRLASGLPVTDTHNGLRALDRDAVAKIRISLDRMAHASEILDRIRASRLEWVEVPVEVTYSRDSLAKGQRSAAAARILFDYLFARWFH